MGYAFVSLAALTNVAGAQSTPTCEGQVVTIVGTDDRLFGTDGPDVITRAIASSRVTAASQLGRQ